MLYKLTLAEYKKQMDPRKKKALMAQCFKKIKTNITNFNDIWKFKRKIKEDFIKNVLTHYLFGFFLILGGCGGEKNQIPNNIWENIKL